MRNPLNAVVQRAVILQIVGILERIPTIDYIARFTKRALDILGFQLDTEVVIPFAVKLGIRLPRVAMNSVRAWLAIVIIAAITLIAATVETLVEQINRTATVRNAKRLIETRQAPKHQAPALTITEPYRGLMRGTRRVGERLLTRTALPARLSRNARGNNSCIRHNFSYGGKSVPNHKKILLDPSAQVNDPHPKKRKNPTRFSALFFSSNPIPPLKAQTPKIAK